MSHTAQALRTQFIQFYQKKAHLHLESASLVPDASEQSLLLVPAGMVPLKPYFLGLKPPAPRAVSIQKCVRVGGKHNDLDEVGYTKRHHTFFEMLGNFSFGDYFKREAIQYAFEFLTQHLNLPVERLWFTVFEEEEGEEARKIWIEEIGIPEHRIFRCSEQDNFWSMGDTGPCGPCTEIFYDYEANRPYDAGKNLPFDVIMASCVEIWNLVFMQYNRQTDGSMEPLPKPSVDTGMGLERMLSVLEGVKDNYKTSLFVPLIEEASSLLHIDDRNHRALRVIADHIRSASFLIFDGVLPSHEGRGYVVRRIIRRAWRHAYQQGARNPFLYRLVALLVEQMKLAYPALKDQQSHIEQVLQDEEQQFLRVIGRGLDVFQQYISTHPQTRVVPGDLVFQLYDTYGFPKDLTADVARESQWTIDEQGFKRCMAEQRARSQRTATFSHASVVLEDIEATCFRGYKGLEGQGRVVALLDEQAQRVDTLPTGAQGALVLDQTPFYAQGGGQVGDCGQANTSEGSSFYVQDTQKSGACILHWGSVQQGSWSVGQQANLYVDPSRKDTARNHSATHLLHAALHRCLSLQAQQKGSLVEPHRLRFDFAYTQPLTLEQIISIEYWVNEQIRCNHPVESYHTTIDEAKKQGATALFEHKYGDQVRLIRMGQSSLELCGGTHVQHSGEIGWFKIISQSSVASGIRRVEAVTGQYAEQWVHQRLSILEDTAHTLKTSVDHVHDKLAEWLEKQRILQSTLEVVQRQADEHKISHWIAQAQSVGPLNLIFESVEHTEMRLLRQWIDILKRQPVATVAILWTCNQGRTHFIVGVSPKAIPYIRADTLASFISQCIKGKAGGRADMAQGGSPQDMMIQKVRVVEWLMAHLS